MEEVLCPICGSESQRTYIIADGKVIKAYECSFCSSQYPCGMVDEFWQSSAERRDELRNMWLECWRQAVDEGYELACRELGLTGEGASVQDKG